MMAFEPIMKMARIMRMVVSYCMAWSIVAVPKISDSSPVIAVSCVAVPGHFRLQ